MKGISVWLWVIGGVIIGFVLFAIYFQYIGFVTANSAKQDAIATFQEMTGTINGLCDSFAGTSITKTYSYPASVSLIYSTNDEKLYEEKNNRTYGSNLCLKLPDERSCSQAKCEVEFDPIKNQTTISSILDTLSGKTIYQQYQLKITKTDCGVSALLPDESPSNYCVSACKMVSLMSCNDNTILALANPNVLVFTDMFQINNCCSGNDKIMQLLGNAANYFGGKKILIAWELDLYDPTDPSRAQMMNSLNDSGFSVTSLRHTSALTYDILQNYDQLWLFRPGWCTPNIEHCGGSIQWGDSEISAIKNFAANGGKIFLFTDTSGGEYAFQTVVNKILSSLNTGTAVDGSYACGSADQVVTTSDIVHNEITYGISSFGLNVPTRIQCS